MNHYSQNTSSPFKVFQTEDEWDAEVKKIIESCMAYLSQNRQGANTPPAQSPPASDGQSPAGEPSGSPDAEQKLKTEIAEMQKEVPGFDFKKLMMTNEAFKNYIMHGYSVKDAYILSMSKEQKTQKKRLGIRENGIQSGRSGASVNDAVSMNDQDFKNYIKSIMGGNL